MSLPENRRPSTGPQPAANYPYGTQPQGPPMPGQPMPGQPMYGQQPASLYQQPHQAQPQHGQPQYGQPQYGQPQYAPPQYVQPQYVQPQYGAPQYGAPQYGQQPNQPAYDQFGRPIYQQPAYAQPAYEQPAAAGNNAGWNIPAVAVSPSHSVTQKLRRKNFMEARTTLIAVGCLMLLSTIYSYFTATAQIDRAIDDQIRQTELKASLYGQKVQIDKKKVAEGRATAMAIINITCAISAVLGVIYIGLGFFVAKAPMVITGIGLVLYLGEAALIALINPLLLLNGIIFRVLFSLGLIAAFTSAVKYEKEQRRLEELAARWRNHDRKFQRKQKRLESIIDSRRLSFW